MKGSTTWRLLRYTTIALLILSFFLTVEKLVSLYFSIVSLHSYLGIHEILEDYIHHEFTRKCCIVGIQLICLKIVLLSFNI
uniref:Succinate:cytochrome c oxidoreductase subunit 4 n=1 Tax=Mesostigma viride TaxID=41882 RepID=Q8W9R7_MESVI|nr:succinate:cytochrome c oxidoreductase subunit 4 [Mesostigma viride]AAL36741.1 succinate:cytochrome c oxidoreductase subunit 4 [Mesostigma viride]